MIASVISWRRSGVRLEGGAAERGGEGGVDVGVEGGGALQGADSSAVTRSSLASSGSICETPSARRHSRHLGAVRHAERDVELLSEIGRGANSPGVLEGAGRAPSARARSTPPRESQPRARAAARHRRQRPICRPPSSAAAAHQRGRAAASPTASTWPPPSHPPRRRRRARRAAPPSPRACGISSGSSRPTAAVGVGRRGLGALGAASASPSVVGEEKMASPLGAQTEAAAARRLVDEWWLRPPSAEGIVDRRAAAEAAAAAAAGEASTARRRRRRLRCAAAAACCAAAAWQSPAASMPAAAPRPATPLARRLWPAHEDLSAAPRAPPPVAAPRADIDPRTPSAAGASAAGRQVGASRPHRAASVVRRRRRSPVGMTSPRAGGRLAGRRSSAAAASAASAARSAHRARRRRRRPPAPRRVGSVGGGLRRGGVGGAAPPPPLRRRGAACCVGLAAWSAGLRRISVHLAAEDAARAASRLAAFIASPFCEGAGWPRLPRRRSSARPSYPRPSASRFAAARPRASQHKLDPHGAPLPQATPTRVRTRPVEGDGRGDRGGRRLCAAGAGAGAVRESAARCAAAGPIARCRRQRQAPPAAANAATAARRSPPRSPWRHWHERSGRQWLAVRPATSLMSGAQQAAALAPRRSPYRCRRRLHEQLVDGDAAQRSAALACSSAPTRCCASADPFERRKQLLVQHVGRSPRRRARRRRAHRARRRCAGVKSLADGDHARHRPRHSRRRRKFACRRVRLRHRRRDRGATERRDVAGRRRRLCRPAGTPCAAAPGCAAGRCTPSASQDRALACARTAGVLLADGRRRCVVRRCTPTVTPRARTAASAPPACAGRGAKLDDGGGWCAAFGTPRRGRDATRARRRRAQTTARNLEHAAGARRRSALLGAAAQAERRGHEEHRPAGPSSGDGSETPASLQRVAFRAQARCRSAAKATLMMDVALTPSADNALVWAATLAASAVASPGSAWPAMSEPAA